MSDDTIWTYKKEASDHWQHNGQLTREEALEEGFNELDLDEDEAIEVFPIFLEQPKLWDLDIPELLDEYCETHYAELPEDWADMYLYRSHPHHHQLKPEVEAALKEALTPHWEAMRKALEETLIKLTGGVFSSGTEERISREEYEEMLAKKCATCKGDGRVKCETCYGKTGEGFEGRLVLAYCGVRGCDVEGPGHQTCPDCDGSGDVPEKVGDQ